MDLWISTSNTNSSHQAPHPKPIDNFKNDEKKRIGRRQVHLRGGPPHHQLWIEWKKHLQMAWIKWVHWGLQYFTHLQWSEKTLPMTYYWFSGAHRFYDSYLLY